MSAPIDGGLSVAAAASDPLPAAGVVNNVFLGIRHEVSDDVEKLVAKLETLLGVGAATFLRACCGLSVIAFFAYLIAVFVLWTTNTQGHFAFIVITVATNTIIGALNVLSWMFGAGLCLCCMTLVGAVSPHYIWHTLHVGFSASLWCAETGFWIFMWVTAALWTGTVDASAITGLSLVVALSVMARHGASYVIGARLDSTASDDSTTTTHRVHLPLANHGNAQLLGLITTVLSVGPFVMLLPTVAWTATSMSWIAHVFFWTTSGCFIIVGGLTLHESRSIGPLHDLKSTMTAEKMTFKHGRGSSMSDDEKTVRNAYYQTKQAAINVIAARILLMLVAFIVCGVCVLIYANTTVINASWTNNKWYCERLLITVGILAVVYSVFNSELLRRVGIRPYMAATLGTFGLSDTDGQMAAEDVAEKKQSLTCHHAAIAWTGWIARTSLMVAIVLSIVALSDDDYLSLWVCVAFIAYGVSLIVYPHAAMKARGYATAKPTSGGKTHGLCTMPSAWAAFAKILLVVSFLGLTALATLLFVYAALWQSNGTASGNINSALTWLGRNYYMLYAAAACAAATWIHDSIVNIIIITIAKRHNSKLSQVELELMRSAMGSRSTALLARASGRTNRALRSKGAGRGGVV